MLTRRPSPMALPVLLAGLMLAAPVGAQTNLATGPAAGPAIATVPGQAGRPASPARDAAVERRITELHAQLKITPAEQKPFDDFATVMRENAAGMGELAQKRRATAVSGTALDQMEAYGQMAQAHADDMRRLVPAFATLYGALSPEQKKSADQSFRAFANGPRAARG